MLTGFELTDIKGTEVYSLMTSAMRHLVLLILCLLLGIASYAEERIFDKEGYDIHNLCCREGERYVVQYKHSFTDTLYIPANCVLEFDGGRLAGPIVFNNTKLKGKVDLKGFSIKGRIKNKVFDASWLCVMDGVTDDAPCINSMINVCDNIFFPKGIYRLVSEYCAKGILADDYLPSITSHIGINKSNVHLKGEAGTVFYTEEALGVISIFSQPRQIENSIRNISIEGIAFNVKNDGINYRGMTHSIKTIGVNGLSIKNCTFNDYWGDAICLSHYGDEPRTGERSLNQNVIIAGNFIQGGNHHNNRNGISVISGKNIIIKNNHLANTSRNDKPGGIDIEPNNSAYTIDNIRIENNVLEDIQGSGGAICIIIDKESPAHGVSVVGNTIRNSRNGLFIRVCTDNTTDSFVIKNNTFDSKTPPFFFSGSGTSKNWVIRENVFKRSNKKTIPADIKVENLDVKKNKSGILMSLLLWAKSVWDDVASFFNNLYQEICATLSRWKDFLLEWINGLLSKGESLCSEF